MLFFFFKARYSQGRKHIKNFLWPTFGTLEKINSLNVLILLNFFVQDFEKDVYIRKKLLYYQ